MTGPKSEVFNQDCMIGMRQFPDKYFELAIVDPPYGINAANMQMGHNPTRKGANQYPGESTAVKLSKKRLNGGGAKLKNRILNKAKIDWDNEQPSKEYWLELFRVSKNQIIFGGNYFELAPSRGVGCWDKLQPWDNFSQWEMVWTSFDCPAWMYRYSNTGGANAETKIHPTQKPINVYRFIMKKFGNEGDKILDTHGGSLSSRIAAHDLGFDFTAYELDPIYYADSCKRFEQYKSQLKLF